ncbi:hypothetical protein TNCV_4000791 [Trichonephila clavipes]|nr:hypothetical protein TNCV_4000791 [Trichonephila clavipes]
MDLESGQCDDVWRTARINHTATIIVTSFDTTTQKRVATVARTTTKIEYIRDTNCNVLSDGYMLHVSMSGDTEENAWLACIRSLHLVASSMVLRATNV